MIYLFSIDSSIMRISGDYFYNHKVNMYLRVGVYDVLLCTTDNKITEYKCYVNFGMTVEDANKKYIPYNETENIDDFLIKYLENSVLELIFEKL